MFQNIINNEEQSEQNINRKIQFKNLLKSMI